MKYIYEFYFHAVYQVEIKIVRLDERNIFQIVII